MKSIEPINEAEILKLFLAVWNRLDHIGPSIDRTWQKINESDQSMSIDTLVYNVLLAIKHMRKPKEKDIYK